MVIIKNYKVPIYKELAKAGVELATPATQYADVLLKTKQSLEIEYFNKTPCQIYNIDNSKNNSITITSNTLGILISNIKDPITDEFYFFKVQVPEFYTNSPDLLLELKGKAEETFGSFVIFNNFIFHNRSENLIKFLNNELYANTPVLDISLHNSLNYPLVKSIRHLKKEFKITIKLNADQCSFKFKNEHLFGVNNLTNSVISLNPFIYKNSQVIKHSFYKLYKEETFLTDLFESYELESHVISDSLNYTTTPPFNYTTVGYNTEYSNLHIPIIALKTFIYFNEILKQIVASPTLLQESSTVVLLAIITKKSELVKSTFNTYKNNTRTLPNFKKLFITNKSFDFDLVPAGSIPFVYSLRDIIRNKQTSIETESKIINQLNKKQNWDLVDIVESPASHLDLLVELSAEINSYFEEDFEITYLNNYSYEVLSKE